MQLPFVSTLCQKMKNQLNRKVGSEEHQNWARIGELQPVACKVNMEWKAELNL